MKYFTKDRDMDCQDDASFLLGKRHFHARHPRSMPLNKSQISFLDFAVMDRFY